MHIYPIFDEIERDLVVNFYDGDGNIIKTEYVKYEFDAIPPTLVTKTPTDTIYYVFKEWKTTDYLKVTNNVDIYPDFYEENRWNNVYFYSEDNELLDHQLIEYGSSANNPLLNGLNPIVEYLESGLIRVITGWDKDFTNITKDIDIIALYDEVERYYSVNFY